MPDFYKGSIPIIDTESNAFSDVLFPKGATFGMVPPDMSQPQPMFAPPSDMELIPESELDARYDEQERLKSSLEHVYLSGPNGEPAFVNLDQNGHGYCWAYSVAQSVMIDRLKRNLPMVRLNPHSVAAIIKRGADQGGWCGLSAEFFTQHGCAVEGSGPNQWPLHSRDIRNDTLAMRAEMSKYKITEDWCDLTRNVYDRNLTRQQLATSQFNNIAGPGDYNWWGHSVCRLRWVRVERGNWGQLILNSWKNWGRHGLSVLVGSKAVSNGALGIRSTTA